MPAWTIDTWEETELLTVGLNGPLRSLKSSGLHNTHESSTHLDLETGWQRTDRSQSGSLGDGDARGERRDPLETRRTGRPTEIRGLNLICGCCERSEAEHPEMDLRSPTPGMRGGYGLPDVICSDCLRTWYGTGECDPDKIKAIVLAKASR